MNIAPPNETNVTLTAEYARITRRITLRTPRLSGTEVSMSIAEAGELLRSIENALADAARDGMFELVEALR